MNRFRDADWFALRVDSSGSGTDAELPDVLAANQGRIVVVELKFTSGKRISVSREKLDGLMWLANHLDASPFVCARFSGDTDFYFFPPGMCKQNEKSITVTKDDVSSAMVLV